MSDFLNAMLPKGIVPATMVNPKCMLIYSEYKVGKGELAKWLSAAPGSKVLWLDYEDGSEAQSAHRINVVKKVRELNKGKHEGDRTRWSLIGWLLRLAKDLAAEDPPRYDIIIHDKIDTLENWCIGWATRYYKATPVGSTFTGDSVLELPNGGGYLYLRQKFEELWNALSKAAPHSIFFGSLRTKYMGKENTSVSAGDLALCGKVREIAAGISDAPAYLYRRADGSNWLSFKTVNGEGTFCGCRIPRLEGKEFRLSWKNGDGRVTCEGWREIWVDEGAGASVQPTEVSK